MSDEQNTGRDKVDDAVLPGRKRPVLPLERFPFDPSLHKVVSMAHASVCSWHGRGCQETPVWSYRTPMGMVSACERGAGQIEKRYGPPQSLEDMVEIVDGADERNGGKKDHDDEE
jgi:hypothetical protein